MLTGHSLGAGLAALLAAQLGPTLHLLGKFQVGPTLHLLGKYEVMCLTERSSAGRVMIYSASVGDYVLTTTQTMPGDDCDSSISLIPMMRMWMPPLQLSLLL